MNDAFFTRQRGTVLDTATLYQESERRREMHSVRLKLTWRSGEQDSAFFRRRNQQQPWDPGDGGKGSEDS